MGSTISTPGTSAHASDWHACSGKLLGQMSRETIALVNRLSPAQLDQLAVRLEKAVSDSSLYFDGDDLHSDKSPLEGAIIAHAHVGAHAWNESRLLLAHVTVDELGSHPCDLEGARYVQMAFARRLRPGQKLAGLPIAQFLRRYPERWPSHWSVPVAFAGTISSAGNHLQCAAARKGRLEIEPLSLGPSDRTITFAVLSP